MCMVSHDPYIRKNYSWHLLKTVRKIFFKGDYNEILQQGRATRPNPEYKQEGIYSHREGWDQWMEND